MKNLDNQAAKQEMFQSKFQAMLQVIANLGMVSLIVTSLAACGSSSEELALAKSTQAQPAAPNEPNPPVLLPGDPGYQVVVAEVSPVPEASPTLESGSTPEAGNVAPGLAVFLSPLNEDRVFGYMVTEVMIPNVSLEASDEFEFMVDSLVVATRTGDHFKASINTKLFSNGLHDVSIRAKGASNSAILGKVKLNFQNGSLSAMDSVGGSGGILDTSSIPISTMNLEGMILETNNMVRSLTPVWRTAYGADQVEKYGPAFGTDHATKVTLSCSQFGNYRVSGIFGRSGSLIDKLGLICKKQFDPTKTINTFSYGGSGGSEFKIECPLGKFVTAMDIRSGSSIDNIKISCK